MFCFGFWRQFWPWDFGFLGKISPRITNGSMYFTQGSREGHLSDPVSTKDSPLPIPILLAIPGAQKQKHHEHFERNSKKETCHSTTGGPANHQRLTGANRPSAYAECQAIMMGFYRLFTLR